MRKNCSLVLLVLLGVVIGFGGAEPVRPPQFNSQLANWLKTFECLFCRDFIQNLWLGVEQKVNNKELDVIEDLAIEVCLHASSLDMGFEVDFDVCKGMIEISTPSVYYIFFQSVLGPDHVCEMINACPPSPSRAWNVTFSDTPKPPVTPPKRLSPFDKKYRVLHLSDLHYQPDYKPGSNAVCGEPVCCREANGPAASEADAAGYWGDYRNCDPPKWTVENALQNAATTYNGTIDFIIYSGDTPNHVDWDLSPGQNTDMMNDFYDMIRQYFPGVPFYGTLGNHAPSPLNMFPSDNVYLGADDEANIQWLYDAAADAWHENLDPEAEARLRNGGFYAQRVKGFDDLIVISLNMNFGHPDNWWLLVDSTDPYGMLQWLSDTLQKAEDNGDKVMIIGHQPSAEEVTSFKDVYFDLALRYESTILGHFMGHTHRDELRVYLDRYNTSRAFSVCFTMGSVTFYSNMNSLYRVYEFDHKTHQLRDSKNYIFNLTEANLAGPNTPPNWFMEYSAKDAYGLNSSSGISFQDWADLTVRFETDDKMWNDYFYYKTKSYGQYGRCTGSCQANHICYMRNNTRSGVDFCSSMNDPPTVQELGHWMRKLEKHC